MTLESSDKISVIILSQHSLVGDPSGFRAPARVRIAGSIVLRQAIIWSSVGQPVFRAIWRDINEQG